MKSEKFLRLYLDEHKLKFKQKNDVYTIMLDAKHKKWFNTAELKVTFNPKEKTDEVVLLNKNHGFISTMSMQHLDQVPIASVKIVEDGEGIIELNERLTEINTLNTLYQIDEKQSTCTFTYFEVTINTAKNKVIIKKPLIKIEDTIIDASGIEESTFEDYESDLKPEKKYGTLLDALSNNLKPELDKLWDEHEKDMGKLAQIQYDYNDQQFDELNKKESAAYTKIRTKESQRITARSFTQQANCTHDIKILTKKYEQLKKSNELKRLKITNNSKKQMLILKDRDLKVKVNILAYAEINVTYYQINYENKEKYFFVPCLHKFIKVTS